MYSEILQKSIEIRILNELQPYYAPYFFYLGKREQRNAKPAGMFYYFASACYISQRVVKQAKCRSYYMTIQNYTTQYVEKYIARIEMY